MSGEYAKRGGRLGWQATSYKSITEVNNTSLKALMKLRLFKERDRITLGGFKNRWNKDKWMQGQRGYLQRACLYMASGAPRARAFCMCGLNYHDRQGKYHFQTCKENSICPSCNWHLRVEPAEREYLPAFDQARHWYAITIGWQSDPRKAGLHWVIEQDEKGKAKDWDHFRPWAERPDATRMPRPSVDDFRSMEDMAGLPFKFGERLRKRHWFDGLYGVFEWHFAFYPTKKGCRHTALPHGHFFGNRSGPLTYDNAIEILMLYWRTCKKNLGKDSFPAYPDIEIAPIVTQERLKGWISYEVKAMPLEEFYKEGLRHGCSLTSLNHEFHQTVWDTINLVRSPRKYGNLFVLDPGYIGVQQFKKLTKSQHARLIQKIEEGLTLTDKEEQQMRNHDLAVEQQSQYRLENQRRRKLAKLKRADKDLKKPSNLNNNSTTTEET